MLRLLLAAQVITFTFDDGFDPRKDPRAAEWNRALLSALAKHDVEAMLFPAGRNVDAQEGLELVKDWARAGHAIGNHTFSDRSLGSARVALAEFIDDVEVADRMFSSLPHWTPMLRFPYARFSLSHWPTWAASARRLPSASVRFRTICRATTDLSPAMPGH